MQRISIDPITRLEGHGKIDGDLYLLMEYVEGSNLKLLHARSDPVLTDNIGNVLSAQGDLRGALGAFRASLETSERLAAADDVIDNAGSRDALRKQVAALHQKYLQFRGS